MKPKGVLQTEESNTFFDRILNFTSYLTMAMIFFSMISLCVHVVMRYVYNRPQNWTIDVSCIILLYITMFAAAWVQRYEGHVSIDFIFAIYQQEVADQAAYLQFDRLRDLLCQWWSCSGSRRP